MGVNVISCKISGETIFPKHIQRTKYSFMWDPNKDYLDMDEDKEKSRKTQ